MKSLPAGCVSLLLVAATTSPLAGQASTTAATQAGNGARAAGLGNAFTAVADDATAMTWNPAGLAQLRSPEASIVTNTRLTYARLDIEDAGLRGTNSALSPTLRPVSFASLVYPVSTRMGTFVVGGAYREVFDWRRSDEFMRDYDVNGGETVTNGFSRSGGINAWTMSAAYAPVSGFMIGAAVNRVHGDTEETTKYHLASATRGEGSEMTHRRTRANQGTAVEVGALVAPSDAFRLGLRVALPHSRSFVIQEGVDENPGLERRQMLRVPATWTIGAALDVSERSRVSLDYKHEPWSQSRAVETESGVTRPGSEFDLRSVHAGFETRRSWGDGTRAYRIGAFTQPTALRDANGARAKGWGGALGLGWEKSAFSFDVAATYTRMNPQARWVDDGSRRLNVQQNDLRFTAGLVLRR